MSRCFLSYSSVYEELKEPFRRLLENIGFEKPVDVFDDPSLRSIPQNVHDRVSKADAVVILYGPREKSSNSDGPLQPADWPRTEALIAWGMKKPLTMIVHKNTELPEPLAGEATYPRFDFWDRESFLQNVHHIVKHLLDFKESISQLSGTAAFWYRRSDINRRIISGEQLKLEVYHEVVARESCKTFEHSINAGDDETVTLPTPSDLHPPELFMRSGPDDATISLRFGRYSPREIVYFVEVAPPLKKDQELAYWRSFLLPNSLPLTRAEIADRAMKPGFPQWLPQNTYGEPWDILYDIELIKHRIFFPRDFPPKSCDIKVLHYTSREESQRETERCKPLVRLIDDPAEPVVSIGFEIPKPMLSHSYVLLYEPSI